MSEKTNAFEVNFDGLVGPNHNYAGLSYGNVASVSHRASVSNPREAAKQGLEKMRFLAGLGLKQGVLPPQLRPDFRALAQIGFSGAEHEVIDKLFKLDPVMLAASYSASAMWTANAATVSPSADSRDGRLHFTPANLVSKFHRSLEPRQTSRLLSQIFPDEKYFAHHEPLPASAYFGDEGAANHTRFCGEYGDRGIQFFVYGRNAFQSGLPEPKRYPARQTWEASQAIVRLHEIDERFVVLARQNPNVIDAGVFHNDVISVGNRGLFFVHEEAFFEQEKVLTELKKKFLAVVKHPLEVLEVSSGEVSVADAVQSYLFNTQLISLPSGETVLVAPQECQENPRTNRFLTEAVKRKRLISKVHFFDLRQSMQNGGGPACLRLRVVMNEEELAHCHAPVLFSETLYAVLKTWVERHYRDKLSIDDLRDPLLLGETRTALDELTQILKLPSLYDFQK